MNFQCRMVNQVEKWNGLIVMIVHCQTRNKMDGGSFNSCLDPRNALGLLLLVLHTRQVREHS